MRDAGVLALILSIVAVLALDLSAEAPKDYRSKHFFLHTDLPAERAETLLEELEEMLGFFSKHWKRPSQGIIECYVVADLDNWSGGGIPDYALPSIQRGLGRTVSQTTRIGRKRKTKATVYAAAQNGNAMHESVHAYCRQTFGEVGPLWYAEGVAEIGEIFSGEPGVNCQQAVINFLRRREYRSVEQIVEMKTGGGENYAWAWTLCHLLMNNPNYQDRFQQLGLGYVNGRKLDFAKFFSRQLDQIKFEHKFFVAHMERGYRVDLCHWDWKTEFKPAGAEPVRVSVDAARGWQATGLALSKDQEVTFTADGEWKTSADAKLTSADGAPDGRGKLVGVLLKDNELGKPFELGAKGSFVAPGEGKLFVRCNDAWGNLADNTGSLNVAFEK